MRNRSVPVDGILPHVSYRNVAEAMAWLTRVFGFAEHYRYGVEGDQVSGAQMHLGEAYVMLRTRAGQTPAELGFGTQSLTVFVEDVEGHSARARAEGATIVEELHQTMYGELQYAALDLDGHHWLFFAACAGRGAGGLGRGGHFVTRIGLRVVLPMVAKQDSVPTVIWATG